MTSAQSSMPGWNAGTPMEMDEIATAKVLARRETRPSRRTSVRYVTQYIAERTDRATLVSTLVVIGAITLAAVTSVVIIFSRPVHVSHQDVEGEGSQSFLVDANGDAIVTAQSESSFTLTDLPSLGPDFGFDMKRVSFPLSEANDSAIMTAPVVGTVWYNETDVDLFLGNGLTLSIWGEGGLYLTQTDVAPFVNTDVSDGFTSRRALSNLGAVPRPSYAAVPRPSAWVVCPRPGVRPCPRSCLDTGCRCGPCRNQCCKAVPRPSTGACSRMNTC